MFAINEHVAKKGTEDPIGLIEEFKGEGWVTVRWGVADGHIYREAVHQDDLYSIPYGIFSPEEVEKKQLEKSGAKYRLVEDS